MSRGSAKSRITAALAQRLHDEPHLRLRYFCTAHYQNSALYPVIAQVEHAAGFAREDSPAAKIEKLKALLAQSSADAEDIALVSDLLLLPLPHNPATLNLTPQQKKQKTLEALIRQLEALARDRPVLMVFEDVHWIDPTSRELLDLLVVRVRGLRVLLIVTFRPEFQPPWTGQSHVSLLMLNRLDPSNGSIPVDRLADNLGPLPADVVDEIVERTDGVPFFVEEVTKAVLEAAGGADGRQSRGAVSAIPRARLSVPATLQASLMARLDRLGPAAKEAAQIGATIGREFSYELLIRPRRRAKQRCWTASICSSQRTWFSSAASRLQPTTTSSTLSCRIPRTARYCAARVGGCMNGSPLHCATNLRKWWRELRKSLRIISLRRARRGLLQPIGWRRAVGQPRTPPMSRRSRI